MKANYHWLFPVAVVVVAIVLVLGTESIVCVLELLVVVKVVLELGIIIGVVNTLGKFGVWIIHVAASCNYVNLK